MQTAVKGTGGVLQSTSVSDKAGWRRRSKSTSVRGMSVCFTPRIHSAQQAHVKHFKAFDGIGLDENHGSYSLFPHEVPILATLSPLLLTRRCDLSGDRQCLDLALPVAETNTVGPQQGTEVLDGSEEQCAERSHHAWCPWWKYQVGCHGESEFT